MKKTVNGNTSGVRQTLLDQMAGMYDLTMLATEFLSHELVDALVAATAAINREVLVYVSRAGAVVDVRIGDNHTVGMEEMRLVRNIDRLAGVRCIHTHPNGDGMLSDVDIGSLNSLKLDSMTALGVRDGKATTVYAAFLGEMADDRRETVLFGPLRPYRLPQKTLIDEIYAADARLASPTYDVVQARPDRAVLVGLENNEGYDTIGELAALAETAGLQVVAREVQRRREVDPAMYIGSGKADEISLVGSAAEADLYVFDDELTAIQMRNLENALGAPIIDRTMLILDIFAQRAESREGKLQVELAQLKYRLPRLLGMGRVLSRQGSSGVGMRGPGEKKLEIDRRRIRRRVFELEQELAEIEKQRALRRVRRTANPIPVVALVGYTNAGKSTLLNALSGADALAEDKLFATLDPILRRIKLPNGTECILSDTVGFINKLPHDLVQAFHSTLEEAREADLILHVIDCSSSYYDIQMRVVEDVLGSLGAADTPRINVYNKIDAEGSLPAARGVYAHISARTGKGLDRLLQEISDQLAKTKVRVELLIPYDRYEAVQVLRSLGNILEETHEAEGTRIVAVLDEGELWRVKQKLS